jgi:hypothetical protein
VDRFNELSRGSQIMLVAGLLLFADMFLAWQHLEVLDLIDASANAWHGFWGITLGALVVALLTLLLFRLAGLDLHLPVSEAALAAVLSLAIVVFALGKVLTDDFSTFWSYAGVVLAIVIAVGAWLNLEESRGAAEPPPPPEERRPG